MHEAYKPGEAPADYNYEEFCPYCDNPIPIVVDNDEAIDYSVDCPVCGEQLMLCFLCRCDLEEMEPVDGIPSECDYHDGTCFRRGGRMGRPVLERGEKLQGRKRPGAERTSCPESSRALSTDQQNEAE